MPSMIVPAHWGSSPGSDFHTVKILKDDAFKEYEGFDIGYSNNEESLSNVLTFYIPKTESYSDFRRAIAKYFNIQNGECLRFWVCLRRQNTTIRPFKLVDGYDVDSTSMTELISCHLRGPLSPFNLYLEYANRTSTTDSEPPNTPSSMVFLKYFDVLGQRIYGIEKIYVPNTSKVSTLHDKINRMMGWQPARRILLYEEVKPGLIYRLDWDKSFVESGIMNGDIICFQEDLSTAEIQILSTQHPEFVLDAVQFYAKMRNTPQGTRHPKLPKAAIDFVVLPGQSFEDALKCMQERMGLLNKDLTGYKFTCSNKNDSDTASTNFSCLMTCSICLEFLVDPVSFVDCMHTACGPCAVEWFRCSNVCHQCRRPVRAIHDNHAIAAMVEAYCQFNRLRRRPEAELARLRTKYKPGQLIQVDRPVDVASDMVAEERERPFSTSSCPCCNPGNELNFLCPQPILEDDDNILFPGHTQCADCNTHLPLIPELSSECCAVCTRFTCRELGLECGDASTMTPLSIQPLGSIHFPKKLDINLFETIPIEHERELLVKYARDSGIGTQRLFKILLELHSGVGLPRTSWHGVGRVPFDEDFFYPTDLVCVACARDLVAGSLLSWGQSVRTSLSPARPLCDFGIGCRQALTDEAHAHAFSHIHTPTGNNHPRRLRDDSGAQEDGNRMVCSHTELGYQGRYSFSFDPEEVEFKRDGEASFLCSVVIRSEIRGRIQTSTFPGSTVIRQGEAIAVYLDGDRERVHSGTIRLFLDTRNTRWVRTSRGQIPLGCRPILGGIDKRNDEDIQELYHCAAWLGGVRASGYISRGMNYACIAHPLSGELWKVSDDYELLCWV